MCDNKEEKPPSDVEEEASEAIRKLLPQKSQMVYQREYLCFQKWKNLKNINSVTEKECSANCPSHRSGQPRGNPAENDGMQQMPSNYGMEYVNSSNPMGQLDRSDRSLDQYGINAPRMPAQSTPMYQYNLPARHETMGSQIDYNLSWMPQDVELSDLVEPCPGRRRQKYLEGDLNTALTSSADARQAGMLPAKYLRRERLEKSSTLGSNAFEQDQSSDINDSFFQSKANGDSTEKRSPKQESLLEWFDRTVEKELHKRRLGSLNVGENLVNLETPTNVKDKTPSPSRASKLLFLDASTSGVDIESKLRTGQDNDLLEAVDKLAKAEAMISFEGAVRAAEEAAAAAPPEFAEEAAAARAQDFQAELTGVVKHEFTGLKPIEVIGYVGITRPKKPKKSNNCTC